MNDFHSISDDFYGLDLLTSVSSLEHQTADQSFDDRTLSLSESLHLVSASSMRDENSALGLLDGDVVSKGWIGDLYSGIVPSAEELRSSLETGVSEI